jgi:hypothetical protein
MGTPDFCKKAATCLQSVIKSIAQCTTAWYVKVRERWRIVCKFYPSN